MSSGSPVVRRPWRTASLPKLAGHFEAIEIMDVKPRTLKTWLEPGSGNGEGFGPLDLYMVPPVRVQATPVWAAADLERFMQQIGRKRNLPGRDDMPVRTDGIQRPWRTSLLPDLVGAAEAAEIMGISKMQLSRWRKPGSGNGEGQGPDDTRIMAPIILKATPVWAKPDIVRFAAEHGRQRRLAA